MMRSCPVCGFRADMGGHMISFYGHDVTLSATWPIGKARRAIGNLAVREIRDGVVLPTRLVPVVLHKGTRHVVVDRWSEGTDDAEHVVLVNSQAPQTVIDDMTKEIE